MAKTNATAAVLGSTEVNYLIYRYLQECGFHHSAFTFAHESQMHRCDIDPNLVPPAALVTYVQKGMQYLEAEANIDESGDIPGDFSILEPSEILTRDIDELRALALERRERRTDREAAAASMQQEKLRRKRDRTAKQRQQQRQEQQQQPEQQQQQQQEPQPPAARQEPNHQQAQQQREPAQAKPQQDQQQPAAAAAAGSAAAGGDAPAAAMEVDGGSGGGGIEVSSSETFSGHVNDAFICVWSPTELLLATGSSHDTTARLWDLAPGVPHDVPRLLVQPEGAAARDITTVDWAPDGSRLACGSYDGVARIWGTDGVLQKRLELHSGPIFALKWNKEGKLLLTGSADETARVTNAVTGEVEQVFQYHTGATLDADWRNDKVFATCSTDKEIHVCKVGDSAPLRTWTGHENEVNCVRWDPACRLLASCSDDKTARLWSLTSTTALRVLRGHEQDIYTIKWSPSGGGSANPGMRSLLATASFDKTVKLWDVETGDVAHCLEHAQPVYSLSFSPDGRFVATASGDANMRIFSVADGALVASHDTGASGILEVAWSRVGDKVAASTMSKTVVVADMRRL